MTGACREVLDQNSCCSAKLTPDAPGPALAVFLREDSFIVPSIISIDTKTGLWFRGITFPSHLYEHGKGLGFGMLN